ncbi:MAG: hypothetical protein RMI34_07850 [Chloroherpetonaceae bacterium]|nr:hypothetical protein [Chloroherpetonaceae bacterium]MDW8467534.1 hypothetical protein [Chloroherpetonaceae bacterium]
MQGLAQVLGEASAEDVRERPRELSLRSIEVGLTPYSSLQPLANNTAALPFSIQRATLSALVRLDNTLLYVDYSRGNIPNFPEAVTLISGGAKFNFDFPLVPPAFNTIRPLIAFTTVADLVSATTTPSPQTAGTSNLNLATVGVGAGLGTAYQAQTWIGELKAEAFIAIASQGFSPVVGVATGLIGDVAFQYPYLFGNLGFAASYRFRTTSANFASNTQYSYAFLAHTLTVGITF